MRVGSVERLGRSVPLAVAALLRAAGGESRRGWRRLVRRLHALAGRAVSGSDGRDAAPGADLGRLESPVLLLHGFFATRRSMDVLERRLRGDGHSVLSIRLGGLAGLLGTRRIDDLAETVRAEVERAYARRPGMGPLTVIGHSQGGLVAAYWVKRLGGHRRVRAVITLAAPHRGTPVAWTGLPIASLAPSVLQMTPRSAFLRRLGEGAWPAAVRLTSVYSRDDEIVPYPAAVVDPRGQPGIRNVEVSGSHGDFLLKKRIHDTVLREVRAAQASAEWLGPAARPAA